MTVRARANASEPASSDCSRSAAPVRLPRAYLVHVRGGISLREVPARRAQSIEALRRSANWRWPVIRRHTTVGSTRPLADSSSLTKQTVILPCEDKPDGTLSSGEELDFCHSSSRTCRSTRRASLSCQQRSIEMASHARPAHGAVQNRVSSSSAHRAWRSRKTSDSRRPPAG